LGWRPPSAGKREARFAYLASLLDDLAGDTRVLTIRTRKDVTEKYGRYLADLIAGEVNLNQALVAAGHAVPAEY
jgi:endonuclease YncB( thermonuclease family)